MAIPTHLDLVEALIRERAGSVDDLAVNWEARISEGEQRVGSARDRVSIYRWLKSGLPSQKDAIFGFCAVLDVDPVALLDVDQEWVRKQFGKERRFLRLFKPRATVLSPLWAIYDNEDGWPNNKLSRDFYCKDWSVADFTHDAADVKNVYVLLKLSWKPTDDLLPRVFHFAYRRIGVSDQMWRPYGAVLVYDGEAKLVSEAGDYQSITWDGDIVPVETNFGPEPAEFKVASLHAFDLELVIPTDGRPSLRFR